jgi:DNA-binding transcriptional LysR family regulator
VRLGQPAITKALREIEDIFMTPLFECAPRGLKPTAARPDGAAAAAKRWFRARAGGIGP